MKEFLKEVSLCISEKIPLPIWVGVTSLSFWTGIFSFSCPQASQLLILGPSDWHVACPVTPSSPSLILRFRLLLNYNSSAVSAACTQDVLVLLKSWHLFIIAVYIMRTPFSPEHCQDSVSAGHERVSRETSSDLG